MFISIAAGGTGGHFYPGLAVARELMARGHEVSFIIKKGDYVRPLLDRERIPFVSISAGGFRRTLDPRHLFVVAQLVLGFFEALKHFSSQRPKLLLVMGGYLSVPPALAAKCLGIPVLLHEQNVVPGLANRVLSRLSRQVAVGFEAGMKSFGEKAVLTGNPVRAEFSNLPSPAEARKKWNLSPNKKTILIFGGSLGAHRLNELLLGSLEELKQHSGSFQFIHITGPADVTWVRQKYEQLQFSHYVDSFCHDMPAAYAASDLVISRAGATTVSELMVVHKPAVLVPYPLATGDHQTANAQVLVDGGAAKIYQQRDLESDGMKKVLEEILGNSPGWGSWKTNGGTSSKGHPLEAARKIVTLISEITA